MTIAEITTFPLRIPFRPGAGSAASAWGPQGLSAVDTPLVRVITDDGLVGWGESFGFTGLPVTRRAIDEVIAPLRLGRDPARIVGLMLDVQRKLHVFGRGGPLTHACRRWTSPCGTSPARPPGSRCTGCWAAPRSTTCPATRAWTPTAGATGCATPCDGRWRMDSPASNCTRNTCRTSWPPARRPDPT